MPRHGYKLYHTRVPAKDKVISQKITCLIKPGSIPSVEKSMSKKIFIIAMSDIFFYSKKPNIFTLITFLLEYMLIV